MELTRRAALKGGAAGIAALAAAGALGAASGTGWAQASEEGAREASAYAYAKSSADVSDLEPLSCDVLVIGGGGAGICASLAAAQAGAQVIICEKLGMLGGATILSGGKIPAVGTKQQLDRGEVDTVRANAQDIFRPSNYSVRRDLVYTVAERGKDMIEWTEGFGVTWTLDETLYYGQSAHRMHTAEGAGAGLTQKLIEALDADPSIEQHLDTEIKGLLVDGDAVVGAYGDKLAITARNVVLATSGFGNNDEMLAQYMPEAVSAYKVVAPGATGEGIKWAAELGADLQCMGAWQGYAFHDVDNDKTVEQGIFNNGGIAVNLDGLRFMNEYGGYSELTPHILAQPEHLAFMVFTEEQVAKSAGYDSWREAGIVYDGESVEELASAIGVDADALATTIARYQEGIEAGEDAYNRTKLPAGFEPPYHALKITGEIRHTQGGAATDVACHVLRADGSLIRGLYAAGGCTEGFSSRGGAAYMSGNGLIQALVFGRIAGENAATEDPAAAEPVVWEGPAE